MSEEKQIKIIGYDAGLLRLTFERRVQPAHSETTDPSQIHSPGGQPFNDP